MPLQLKYILTEDMDERLMLSDSCSEESFEHIDPDFDNTYYPELRGLAVADYIPLEKDEIMLRKG